MTRFTLQMVFNSAWKPMHSVRWVPWDVRDVSGSVVCCSLESLWGVIGAVRSVTTLSLFSLSLLQFIPRGALTQPSTLRTRRMQMARLWSSMWRLPVVSKVRMFSWHLHCTESMPWNFVCCHSPTGLMQSPLKSTESSLSLQWLLDQAQERFNRG